MDVCTPLPYGSISVDLPSHIRVGKEGERIAQRYLEIIGFEILDCNVVVGKDEIDIVAFDSIENALVFVEVKSRSKTDADFHPGLNLTREKKEKLCRSAEGWISESFYEDIYRIDALLVSAGKVVRHIQDLTNS